MIREFNMD